APEGSCAAYGRPRQLPATAPQAGRSCRQHPPGATHQARAEAGRARKGQPTSLDHLVRARQDRLRDREAERSRCLGVYDQLAFGSLLPREIGRLFALQDSPSVSADLAKDSGVALSIAEQTTESGELTKVTDCRNRVA